MRASLCARCLHKLAEVMKEKNLADDYIVDYRLGNEFVNRFAKS
jgi:hypothetical protein